MTISRSLGGLALSLLVSIALAGMVAQPAPQPARAEAALAAPSIQGALA